MSAEQQASEGFRAIATIEERKAVDNSQSFGSGGWITATAFFNHERGQKQLVTLGCCVPPAARDGLPSGHGKVGMAAPGYVADDGCFDVDTLHPVILANAEAFSIRRVSVG